MIKLAAILILLVGCTSHERDINQQCEVTCSHCTDLRLKCHSSHDKDVKDLG